jgi:hypothetical protein
MKKFVLELSTIVVLFVLIVLGYFRLSTNILRNKLGPSTSDQIEMQFSQLSEQKDTLTTLYLGSSRFYRAIAPEIVGPNGFNFAHDNDSYNQEYYKLVYAHNLLPHLKTVIVAYDYVSFTFLSETRNYVYFKYLSKEYQKDYDNIIYDKYIWPLINIPQTLPVTLNALFREEKQYELTNKGQLIFFTGSAADNDEIERPYNIQDVQDQYFYKIIDYCHENDLELVFVNMPIRDGEYRNYPIEYISNMDQKIKCISNIKYIDYSRTPELLSTVLFSDICHFNKEGSTVFSYRLKKDLESILE